MRVKNIKNKALIFLMTALLLFSQTTVFSSVLEVKRLMLDKNFDAALIKIEELSSNDESLFLKGVCLYNLKKTREAALEFRKIKEESPNFKDAAFYISLILKRPPPQQKQNTHKDIKIRALIYEGVKNLNLKVDSAFEVLDLESGEFMDVLNASQINVSAEFRGMNINGNLYSAVRIVAYNNKIKAGDYEYAGNLILRFTRDGLINVINEVDMEEYLKGVVPNEIYTRWHKEAIISQIIIARTYAYHNYLKKKDEPYHLYATVKSQMYKGLSTHIDDINRWIKETKGGVIVYNGEPIEAVYHSNSGGNTASAYEVWGKQVDYLKAKYDPYAINTPDYSWEYKLSYADLRKALLDNGFQAGTVREVKLGERTATRRWNFLFIYTARGTLKVPLKDLRLWLDGTKFKSTRITQIENSSDHVLIKGRGYGHGVGLSQWSAQTMAQSGFLHDEILSYFYDGIEISEINKLEAN